MSGWGEFSNLTLGFCVVLKKLSCRIGVGLPTTHQDSCNSSLMYSELVPAIRECDLAKAALLEWAVLDPCTLARAVLFLVGLLCSIWVLSEKSPFINGQLRTNQELWADISDFRSLWLPRHCCLRQLCLCLGNALKEVSPRCRVLLHLWCVRLWISLTFFHPP